MKRISVLGLGYIGLPTAIIAAEHGFAVAGFDTNTEKVQKINAGDPTILEPEIVPRLQRMLAEKRLHAHDTLQPADCFIVAVPTPFKEGKKADLKYVWRAGAIIAPVLRPGNLILLESTVPVGITDKFASVIEAQSGLKVGVDFFVAHCPERVLPGKIFQELIGNDRVIGGVCSASSQRACEFYHTFVTGKLYVTSARSAEMVKLVENASRDVQIAFANQVAAMCEQAHINPYEVIELANKHPRVHILTPGCGVGGHCIAVDPWFLIESFPLQTSLLKSARAINDARPKEVVKEIMTMTARWRGAEGHEKQKPTVLLLGMTYKPDVDDLRESPSLAIARDLHAYAESMNVLVAEPHVTSAQLSALQPAPVIDYIEGIVSADIVVFLIKHSLFKMVAPGMLAGKMVIDVCGIVKEIQVQQVADSADVVRAHSSLVGRKPLQVSL